MCSAALAQQAAVLCCAAAAVVHRCCAGTPSKIQPSLSAMKLTAWARLVAPATRAGRSTTSCSCTRWSAPSGGRVQPHRSRTLREPTTVFTGACRRVVAVLPSWAWLREPAGRTGVAALASGDTLVRTPYGWCSEHILFQTHGTALLSLYSLDHEPLHG